MAQRIRGAFPLLIPLNPRSAQSLTQQIYEAIRGMILGGRVRAGTRLPSSRELATELAVSRNTVVYAFERLAGEGYTEARAGGGTRVARTVPDDMIRARATALRRPAAGA